MQQSDHLKGPPPPWVSEEKSGPVSPAASTATEKLALSLSTLTNELKGLLQIDRKRRQDRNAEDRGQKKSK